jgi:hypothetical protein
MIRRSANGDTFRMVILTASVLALIGGFIAGAGGAAESIVTHLQGRVSISLPDNGALTVRWVDGERRGISWPRGTDVEFLGSGGFYLYYKRPEEPVYRAIGPGMFEAIDTDALSRSLYEGCEGGGRGPDRGDDDGDGLIDEDRLDGRDNDRDGLIDEDFAAIGDGMVVTRAVEPSTGIIMQQSSYTWNYGHVRDFVGFTTLFEMPPATDEREASIHDMILALHVDFDIGAPDEDGRGEDDRFHFIAVDRDHEERFELPVAADGASYAAVVVFNAIGPGEAVLDTDAFIIPKVGSPDSLRDRLDREAEKAGRALVASADAPDAPPAEAGEQFGDRGIVHRIGGVRRLTAGGYVRIEWALVFGRSAEALAKNVLRAMETYRGVTDENGGRCRWVVPARRAVRREFDMTIASIWSGGNRQAALALSVPEELETEEIEWLRVDGLCITTYERTGSKIVLPLEKEMLARAEPVTIEGQLTDGTIFTASPSGELLRAYGADGDLPLDRLPDESMQMFPNPFLTSLTIDVNAPGPSTLVNSTGHELEGSSSVRIYDVKGRLVRTILEREFLHPGNYQMGWDGLDENGAKVAPGVYYCKLQIGSRSLTKRVILLR